MSVRVGLCKRSLSPSILGLGREAQNLHVPNPLAHKSLCVYNVNGSLSRAVDTGNPPLLWPGLDLWSLVSLLTFWTGALFVLAP